MALLWKQIPGIFAGKNLKKFINFKNKYFEISTTTKNPIYQLAYELSVKLHVLYTQLNHHVIKKSLIRLD